MTNGIAVNKTQKGFDYWHNGTAGSGWVNKWDRDLVVCLERFVGPTRLVDFTEDLMKEWGHGYKLAVPEQLVWWEDE